METGKNRFLSLVIPVYNEEEVLETSFSRMDEVMRSTGYDYEIIYVNDGSRDGTMELLRTLAKQQIGRASCRERVFRTV